MKVDWIETPLKTITLLYDELSLISLTFKKIDYSDYKISKNSFARRQLKEYFEGYRKSFEFNFDYSSLPSFTSKILLFITSIPYGKTMAYSEIAKIFNTSPRAIGVAMRINPLPIFIPCHRVVAKNSIGGYSAGIDIKRKLLLLEGVDKF